MEFLEVASALLTSSDFQEICHFSENLQILAPGLGLEEVEVDVDVDHIPQIFSLTPLLPLAASQVLRGLIPQRLVLTQQGTRGRLLSG